MNRVTLSANDALAKSDLKLAGYGGHNDGARVVITRNSGYHSSHASWEAAHATILPLSPLGYATRVAELEREGMTTSDAQAVADVEFGIL